MYLKSLELRGFKSFADATRLDFEPGITVIVGPNGSGKSNVVDALTWSMGTMSAKSLRGGQMADVIFAGAKSRKAMGRAAVAITIDNADDSLPIEFSEVTVGRAMFATGESSYSLNGTECRQLDVAELLSDTGLGRETHTIVGQGRIDAVLNATPEQRRAFVEEAAGILKHRRRKERALRKLAQMDSHLERLVDVLSEMKRQLRPLERQAEAAQKHAELSERIAQVRLLRALRELHRLQLRWDVELQTRAASDGRLAGVQGRLDSEQSSERQIAQGLAELTPAVRAATETQFSLANTVERSRGLVERIIERRNGLAEAVEEPVAGRDPEELRGEAAHDRATLAEVKETLVATSSALERARHHTRDAERTRRAHEQAAAAEARRRAEARERQIRWEGEVNALRGALSQSSAEQGRLETQLQAQDDRAEELGADVESVQADIQRLDASAPELSEALKEAEDARRRAQAKADEASKAERELARTKASLEARAEALQAAAADPGEAAGTVIAAGADGRIDGVLGSVASLISVPDGNAAALSTALGSLAEAVVVRSRSAAESSFDLIRSSEDGPLLMLVASAPTIEPSGQPNLAPLGAEALADLVTAADAGVQAAVRRALAGCYVCDSLADAISLADSKPDLVFVSRDGQQAGARGHLGGVTLKRSPLLAREAAEKAAEEAAEVGRQLAVAHRRVGDADRELVQARPYVEAAQGALQECDALITAAAERMNRLRKELKRCESETAQLRRQHEKLAQQTEERRARLAELEQRGDETFHPDPRFADSERGDVEAERLDDALAEAREAEVQARLAHSTAEQQAGELRRRIAALENEAKAVEQQLAAREQRRLARVAAMNRCDELEGVGRTVLQQAEASRQQAAAERDQLEEARAAQQRRLGVTRAAVAELQQELQGLKDQRHREDLVRQELSLQLDGVLGRLRELGVEDGRAAMAEADPDDLVEDSARDEKLTEEEEKLSRKLGLLGTVNPLALEEFHSLQERQAFMTDQLDDLRTSKRDLLRVVEKVDERIRDVFGAAFAEIAVEFERIFPRLFPGGTGKLVLTDPDDMLTTGVEVEARPPGKRVKRLSLLSGGERSLTALAVLFAIFAARPSPFYVLDEVEAALDDANLGRFLSVLADFRGASQWIIVTHQRRTMEVADTVYGVTMNSDGVSKVISKKLNETALART